MNKNDKKYRKSGVAIACYVIAAAMLIFVCYQIGSTISTINSYYAEYEMSATPMEYLTYCGQAALQPFFYALAVFMMGFILDTVRMNNKANYLTDEEVENARAAKKEAREAKKLAKGEAAAAKAGSITTTEKSVEADFAKSLDEELKADEKKSGNRNQNGNGQKQPGSSRKSSSYNNRSNSGKTGGKSSGKGNGSGARKSGKKPAAEKSEAKTEE